MTNPMNSNRLYLEYYGISTGVPEPKNLQGPGPQEGPTEEVGLGDTYENFDMEGDYPEDLPEQSSFQSQDSQGSQGIPTEAARETLTELWSGLRNSDLTGTQRSELAERIQNLESAIADSRTAFLDPQTENALYGLQADILGTGPGVGGPTADDPFAVSDMLGEGEAGAEAEGKKLLDQLNGFRAQIQENPNLTDDDKDQFLEKVDRWTGNLTLSPNQETVDQIETEFETLRTEFAEASNFPPSVSRLAVSTGVDPEVIQAIMERHDIDPNHLPSTPDGKIAALLNDPDLSSRLQTELKGQATAYEELVKRINMSVGEANAINAANETSDTSKTDTNSPVAHRWLYNANFHRDDHSKRLIEAREGVATETANLLGALYGKDIQPLNGAEGAGKINFGGKELNVLANGSSSSVGFSEGNSEWPPVELVPVWVDDEGDGMTSIPAWMSESHYPYHRYDTGSNRWTYNDDKLVDIERTI